MRNECITQRNRNCLNGLHIWRTGIDLADNLCELSRSGKLPNDREDVRRLQILFLAEIGECDDSN